MTTQKSNSHQKEDDCEVDSLSIEEFDSRKNSSETKNSIEGPDEEDSKEDEAIMSMTQSSVSSVSGLYLGVFDEDPRKRIKNKKIKLDQLLMDGDQLIELPPEDLVIGKKSTKLLSTIPHFNGFNQRIPHVFVINSVTKARESLCPHLRAITAMLRSMLAQRLAPVNITMQVNYLNLY